jgi:hypothetical protein
MRSRLLIASLIGAASISFAADRVTLSGRVTDNLGQPLENAMDQLGRQPLCHERLLMIPVGSSEAEW